MFKTIYNAKLLLSRLCVKRHILMEENCPIRKNYGKALEFYSCETVQTLKSSSANLAKQTPDSYQISKENSF